MKRQSRQRGQVIPYVAIIILVLAASAFVIYDMGRMVNARIQFQNGADAASLAAVAIKINKHHVDTIMRAAMTQEAIQSQAKINAANAVLAQAIFAGKDNPLGLDPAPIDDNTKLPIGEDAPFLEELKGYGAKYAAHANRAYKHAVKLHRERLMLDAYYIWLEKHAATATREAAFLGYLTNIQGYEVSSLKKNLDHILRKNEHLLENSKASGNQTNVGGFVYANEGAKPNGTFGKTFVEFEANGMSSRSGSSLIKYFPAQANDKSGEFKLRSSSASQVVNKEQLNEGRNPINIGSLLRMNWYSPRLMAIEGQGNKVSH